VRQGQNANKWSTIGVPSNWQLQGFGIYEYGRPNPVGGWPRTHGVYKRTFTTPATWRDKTIFVKFEGVMTDAAVTINGNPPALFTRAAITPSSTTSRAC
jgi:beta-galactosidase/beta-glucuronidase